jgi:NTP pyrophosphatase (non-canonical NTP hydrolase)
VSINTFDEYQEAATKTANHPGCSEVWYPALGLAGASGAVVNQAQKILRDDRFRTFTPPSITDERRAAVRKEIGGVMWYVAALCTDLNLNLGDVCRENIAILASRQERGTLKGGGDNR